MSTTPIEYPDEPQCDRTKPDRESPVPHDYKRTHDEYGSLGSGGSYEVYVCQRPHCQRKAYSPLPD